MHVYANAVAKISSICFLCTDYKTKVVSIFRQLEIVAHAYLGTSSDGARWRTASEQSLLALVILCLIGSSRDAGRDVCPGTVVERLLLCPEDVGVGVLVEVGSELWINRYQLCISLQAIMARTRS